MLTFKDFFFIYERDNLNRLCLVKKNPSIFEIFNMKRFTEYINLPEVNPYFNLKYLKDKKKNKGLKKYKDLKKNKDKKNNKDKQKNKDLMNN